MEEAKQAARLRCSSGRRRCVRAARSADLHGVGDVRFIAVAASGSTAFHGTKYFKHLFKYSGHLFISHNS